MSDTGFKDTRSALAKALGRAIPWKRVVVEKGRLVGVPLAVRWLSDEAISGAALDAVKYLATPERWREEQLYTELGTAIHDLETQLRTLAAGLILPPPEGQNLTPETCALAARDADELRTLLDPDEIRYLHTEWLRHQRSCGPITYAQTDEAVEAFVDSLGKGTTPPSRLRTCEPDTLLSISLCMAYRLSTLPSSSSSPTSPSSDTSDGSVTPSISPPSASEMTTGPTIEVDPPSSR